MGSCAMTAGTSSAANQRTKANWFCLWCGQHIGLLVSRTKLHLSEEDGRISESALAAMFGQRHLTAPGVSDHGVVVREGKLVRRVRSEQIRHIENELHRAASLRRVLVRRRIPGTGVHHGPLRRVEP